jgi:hypothetical protein
VSLFFQIGKQRYCQGGLPLLASIAFIAHDEKRINGNVTLAPLDGSDGPPISREPTGFQLISGVPTAILELRTDSIPEGAYELVAQDRSAVSSPILIFSKESYERLLEFENGESFDDDSISGSAAFDYVVNMIWEHGPRRVERIPEMFDASVLRRGFGTSLSVSGELEDSDRQISVAKLSYGAEAFLSDLSYLATIPVGPADQYERATLHLRIDRRANVSFTGRIRSGFGPPERVIETLGSYFDITELQRRHADTFRSEIREIGLDTFQLSLVVNAESEVGRTSRDLMPEIESPAGAAGAV